jgi:hypothetical protein
MNQHIERACFFTSISTNYIAKAVAWARSVREVYPRAAIYLYVYNLSELPHAKRIELEQACADDVGGQFGLRDPLPLVQSDRRYPYIFSLTEGCTAVKPRAALELLGSYANVTYMDPDTILYLDLDQGRDVSWDLQLIPHITDLGGSQAILNERLFLASGVFNLGYFAVTRSGVVFQFLEWWHRFLERYCYDSMPLGLYVDQRPCDLAPCFIDNLDVVRHPGYNVAWWNLFSDRELVSRSGGFHVVRRGEHFPLVFFHFSNYPGPSSPSLPVARPLPELMSGLKELSLQSSWPDLGSLYQDYDQRCASCASLLSLVSGCRQYQFSRYGKRIPRLARVLYREAYPGGTEWDPFASDQVVVLLRSAIVILGHYRLSDVKSGAKRIIKVLLSLLTPSLCRLDPRQAQPLP